MMVKSVQLGFILALTCVMLSCVAGTRNRETATMTGTIRVVGNEPRIHVVLTTEDAQDTLVTGALTEELRRHHEGEVVALEGSSCTSPFPQFSRCFRATRITIINNGQ
jgi:hypothetical protein